MSMEGTEHIEDVEDQETVTDDTSVDQSLQIKVDQMLLNLLRLLK